MTEVQTLTLADFLLARIAEDERALEDGTPFGYGSYFQPFTPHRLSVECVARRRIVELADAWWDEPAGFSDDGRDGLLAAHDAVLRLLALPYADHPDYRDEWRR